MNFGFTGCHTSVPSLQKLALHAADALQELEEALLAPKPARRRRAPPAVGQGEGQGEAEDAGTPRTTSPRKTTSGKTTPRKTAARARQ
jgi:hypothetical protein